MDHIKILKRAFSVSWNYKVLWVFGILLALTTPRNGGNGGGGGSHGGGSAQILPLHGSPTLMQFGADINNALLPVELALICLVILLVIAGVIVHYVSETSLIRLVDQYETSGEKVGIRQGFRQGWNRAALRMFGIDILIGLGMLVAVLLGLLVAAAPLLAWLTKSDALRAFGTVMSIGLGLGVVFAAILVALGLKILINLFHRACTLENLGVFASIRRGWQVAAGRLGDVLIMALILLAMGLGALIVLIPVAIMVLLAAAVTGGLPALLVWGVASLFVHGSTPGILAAIVGAPIFLLVVVAPLAFFAGLIETYLSSTWTLTYREVVALQATKTQPEPQAT